MSALCSHCGKELAPYATFTEGDCVRGEVLACGTCDRAPGVVGPPQKGVPRFDVDEVIDLFDVALHTQDESHARTLRSEALGVLELQLSTASGADLASFEHLFTELVERHRQRGC